MSKKVFIGYNNIVGVGTTLKSGFESLGIRADFYSNEKKKHEFDYIGDIPHKTITFAKQKPFNYLSALFFLAKIIIKYDYFVFIQLNGNLLTKLRDIKLLKLFNKKTLIVFSGCDARIPEMVESFKWNPCKDCTQEYKSYVSCSIDIKRKKIREVESSYDIIASPIECAGYVEKNFKPFLFPILLDRYKPEYSQIDEKLTILHAPSHHHVKGTRYIDNAISKLKSKYPFIEYICLQNVPKLEVHKKIASAHLVIDQMLVGYYGVFAVEAMAMGKPVICYIRPDIWEAIKETCPIINADPDTLVRAIENFIETRNQSNIIGIRSRKYVEDYHDSTKVAQKMIEWFNEN